MILSCSTQAKQRSQMTMVMLPEQHLYGQKLKSHRNLLILQLCYRNITPPECGEEEKSRNLLEN
jgi:hypothetical protein